ncbi:hypothetical protein ACHQM5_022714 [Ranunculus cassubicifolius]
MEKITTTIHYYLVSHPLISNFHFNHPQTFASSPQFLLTTLFTYLSLTLLLSKTLIPTTTTTPSSPSTLLRRISTFHNLILLLLSFLMAVGCTLSTLTLPSHHLIFCFPPSQSPSGPIFFWAYIFYLSKILEFIDTLLIILYRDTRRLSFLHVYHHSVVLVMCYVWLYTSQSLIAIALVTNASVHVFMYGYYMLCAMGRKPRWKKVVTDCQIVQFVFSFGVSGVMLWYHFSGEGCSGIWGWVFNAVFNASLLALFTNFHTKNYSSSSTTQSKIKKKI